MVQSLQLQSQQRKGDFHHCVHLKDTLPIVFFLLSIKSVNLQYMAEKTISTSLNCRPLMWM